MKSKSGRRFVSNIKSAVLEKNNISLFSISSAATFLVLSYLTLKEVTGYRIDYYAIMNGFWYTVMSFLMNGIISLLIGAYAVRVLSRFGDFRAHTKNTKGMGLIGVSFGALAAGCPTCGAFVFGLLGAPLALMALPFQGLELKALSILLLLASLYLVSKSQKACRVKI